MAVRFEATVLATSVLAAAVLLLAGCATPTPIPPGATDAEADEVVAQALTNYWSVLGPGQERDFPKVDRIAFTTTESWASAQVTCLLAAGLTAREVSGGYAIDDNGPLTAAEGIDAQRTCLAQYPVDPRTQGFLSNAQILYMYDYFTQRLAPCLELLGYDVGGAPNRDLYVNAVRSGILWSPYFDERARPLLASPAQWSIINATCPPLPVDPFSAFQPPVAG
jgi:hypothetical protein